MKTGYARVCINPPYGAPILGYYERRFTKGIADNLYARAAAFDDGVKKAVIIAVDIGLLGQVHYDAIKDGVMKAVDIDRDAIFINCSHTHTGPVLGTDTASGTQSDPAYDAFLVAGARDAAVYAFSDLHESRICTAEAEAKHISFCRRFRMKDGSVATNPGVGNPNIDHALGTPNETVKLVKIIREGADDIFIINFGTHPDTTGGEYISADYMGHACAALEGAVPGTKCMFLQGAQGDVNHVNVNPTAAERTVFAIDFDGVPRGVGHAKHMGRVLAGAVLSVCSIAEEVKADTISYASKTVCLPSNQENDRIPEAKKIYKYYEEGRTAELPYKEMELTTVVAEAIRILDLENGPEAFPFVLSALKIGDLVFAGIGGEPFTELGNRICAESSFKNTVLCALTNNEGKYIPTAHAYEEGGYEARSSLLKPGGDDIIAEGMAELLRSL